MVSALKQRFKNNINSFFFVFTFVSFYLFFFSKFGTSDAWVGFIDIIMRLSDL